ncbi:HlyD family efflux transporter periplasmic adaptor subunit [Pseudothauera nasutitermitis]|uniref:HlyD family efflux transporter periplasmic adaptor subunit n=1 Tax=Pseudothauera nasutitermitis TaxID=2565930 RepID=A0A4S4AW31_9RHOO|nr:HlyD family efflux transporter periplasmic adaptor subunit [Pseudothauera nasutitermitis]
MRQELDLLPGPPLPDGQPTWTLHDPVRNLFFQLDWPSFEILRRWELDDPQAIAAAIDRDTPLEMTPQDVEALLLFLRQHQLLQPEPGSAGLLAAQRAQMRGSRLKWLLHNYLFFRVPLVKPDRWLTRWAGRLDFLFSRAFLRLTVLAAVLGLISVYRSWESFSATLVDLLSWEGLLAYGATLVAVKVLHELGHGFTAKRYGCRVPTMGVAFMVLWPVAYTDTNEVWKLTRRDQRLKVAAAGIATELTIAVWATLAWAWLPDGTPKSVAFLLSTTTWVSTLLINASPFMRFDGYFLLSDWLQLPNLHARAFALARWDLRERLFALGEEPPEHFPRARAAGLILFAWATWLYRLVLFLGIAVLVYHFFIKMAGILLFVVEIAWFILMPLASELKAWRERWPAIRRSTRARRSAWIAAAGVLLFVLPWPTPVMTQGLLQPRLQWVLYGPAHARLNELPHAEGAPVEAGATLMRFDAPLLQARGARSEARREQLSRQSAAAGFDPDMRRNWLLLQDQEATAAAEQATIAADAQRYAPRAPFAGEFRDLAADLRAGDWVAEKELLGRLIAPGARQVVTYVEEADIQRIAVGDRGLFIADGLAGPAVRLRVASIDRDATRILTEPALATPYGGHVLVREQHGGLYPERAIYRVLLDVEQEMPASAQHTWRGRVSIAGRGEAPGLRFARTAAGVFWREMGF